MVISNANIFSESFRLLENFLKDISGLDPRNRYKAKWIYSSFPEINSKGFNGYPMIVLRVDPADGNPSHDRTISEKTFRVLISVYSNEASDVDSIADKIFDNLKDETKLTDFKAKELSNSPIDWDLDVKGKKIIFRNIGMILKVRI